MQNGMIYKGERIVVPMTIRNNLLKRIHNAHNGIQGCLRRARESFYWPIMAKDTEEFTSKYEACNTYANKQGKEPKISHRIPKDVVKLLLVTYFNVRTRIT